MRFNQFMRCGCLLILCILFVGKINAQLNIVNCDAMLSQAKAALNDKQYEAALTKLRAVKACDNSKEMEVSELIVRVFNAIEKEKQEAINQRKIAEHQTFIARMGMLSANANSNRNSNPTVAAQLAARLFSQLPTKNSSRLLHDILSDTLALFYTKTLDYPDPRLPLAINDSLGCIVQFSRYCINIIDINTGVTKPVLRDSSLWDSYSTAITSDGSLAIYCDYDKNVWLLRPFENRKKVIMTLASMPEKFFLSDQKNLIVIHYRDKGLSFVDTTGFDLGEVSERDRIEGTAISRNEEWFCYTTRNLLAAYNIPEKKLIHDSTHYHDGVAFSKSDRLVSISWAGIVLSDVTVDGFQNRTNINFNEYYVSKCMFTDKPDELLLLESGGERIFHIDTFGNLKHIIRAGEGNAFLQFALSERFGNLVVNTERGNLLWNIYPKEKAISIPMQSGFSYDVLQIIDENQFVTQEINNVAYFTQKMSAIKIIDRNLSQVKLLDSIQRSDYIKVFYYSPSLNRSIILFDDHVRIKNHSTGEIRRYVPNRLNRFAFAVSKDLRYIATVMSDSLQVYDVKNDNVFPSKLKFRPRSIAFFGDSLLLGDYSPGVYIVSKEGRIGRRFITSPLGSPSEIFTSMDQSYIFLQLSGISGSKNPVTVFDKRGHPLKTFHLPQYIRAIGTSSDNSKLIVKSVSAMHEELMPLAIIDSIAPLSVIEKISYNFELPFEQPSRYKDEGSIVKILEYLVDEYDVNPDGQNRSLINKGFEMLTRVAREPRNSDLRQKYDKILLVCDGTDNGFLRELASKIRQLLNI